MPSPDAGSRPVALSRLRTAMIEKKMTQAELADAADCHEKTIQNLLNGRSVRDQTLFDVCMVLGLDFDEFKPLWAGDMRDQTIGIEAPGKAGDGGDVAPLYMGAYSRVVVDHYLGSYLTIRPAFRVPGHFFAYRTDIVWDAGWPSLLFRESERSDKPFQHQGRLYIPSASVFVHLVSLTKGAMRSILVSQPDGLAVMRGMILTQNKRGAAYFPVAAPIVYCRRDGFDADAFGEIGPASRHFDAYRALIDDAMQQGYANMVGGT